MLPNNKLDPAGVRVRRDTESAGSLISGSTSHRGGSDIPPNLPRAPSSIRNQGSHLKSSLVSPLMAYPCVLESSSAGFPGDTCQQRLFPVEGSRSRRAPQRQRCALYEDYQAHVEQHIFAKLNATLGRLERRAQREHAMYAGAAGWNSEQQQEREDRRRLRAASPPPHLRHRGESMAELLQHRQDDMRPRSTPRLRPTSAILGRPVLAQDSRRMGLATP